jgi:hypothetical protein
MASFGFFCLQRAYPLDKGGKERIMDFAAEARQWKPRCGRPDANVHVRLHIAAADPPKAIASNAVPAA